MSIHKEGYAIIIASIIVIVVLNYVVHLMVKNVEWKYIIYGVLLIFFLFILLFFRSPERVVTMNGHHIVAPCDGKVVIIQEVEEPEYFKGKRLQVSIFMSPLNVHVNWYPISGTIKYYKYHPGKYLVAWHPKSSILNERTTVVIENTENKKEVLVRQIAGMVARRIVCYAKEGTTATQGDELGFIKFGSRIDLFLPLDAKVNVSIDQKVVGNSTVIATFE